MFIENCSLNTTIDRLRLWEARWPAIADPTITAAVRSVCSSLQQLLLYVHALRLDQNRHVLKEHSPCGQLLPNANFYNLHLLFQGVQYNIRSAVSLPSQGPWFLCLRALRTDFWVRKSLGGRAVCSYSLGSSFINGGMFFQHMKSPRHQGEEDSDSEDSEDTEEEETHCEECDRNFADSIALNQHRVNSSKHNWCSECSRDFSSANALSQVLYFKIFGP